VQIGVPVPVTPMLYQAVQFALLVAEESDGAFDPTVGRAMENRGFDREHRTGRRIHTTMASDAPASDASDVSYITYRDVQLDAERQTVTLDRPLVLDLGAVAKGLAVDMAAKELRPLGSFAIDAGGDLYLGGSRPDGEAWVIGIRHPRQDRTRGLGSAHIVEAVEDELIDVLHVSDLAVCTSGDYERRSADDPEGHHIIDPRSNASPHAVASVTVVAPTAMVADALATAAFVLGPVDGLRFCERLGVDALMLSPTGERYATRGMLSGQYRRRSALLSNAEGSSHDRPGPAGGDVSAGRRQ
jgi:thiamine biosynthesis lipoprotein